MHLCHAMLRPKMESIERVREFITKDVIDFGPARLERQGKAAVVTINNPRFLNAEDDDTLDDTETAVDIAILDPMSEICVLRGGVVDHPKYRGRKVFSAGINLTHLYRGKIPFLWYIRRDMGVVNKMFRGLAMRRAPVPTKSMAARARSRGSPVSIRFAIGGGCQYLLAMDYVVAGSDAYMTLPARKEGIIPGAANLRLPRFVGARVARQAILAGRRLDCDSPGRPHDLRSSRAAGRGGRRGRARGRGLHRLRHGQRRRATGAPSASAKNRSTLSAATWRSMPESRPIAISARR